MKKKFTILLMAFIVVLSACSNDKKNEGKDSETTKESLQTVSENAGNEESKKDNEEKTDSNSGNENKDKTEDKETGNANLNEDQKFAQEYLLNIKKGEIDLDKAFIPKYLKDTANEQYFKNIINSEEFKSKLPEEEDLKKGKFEDFIYDVKKIGEEDKKEKKMYLEDFYKRYQTIIANEFMNFKVNGLDVKSYLKSEDNKDTDVINYEEPHYGKNDGIDSKAKYSFTYFPVTENKIGIDDPVFGKIEQEINPEGYFDSEDTFSIDRDIFLLPKEMTEEKVEKDLKELITNYLKAYEEDKPLDQFFEKDTDKKVQKDMFTGIYGKEEAEQFKKPKGFNTRIDKFELFKYNYHSDGTIYARIKMTAQYDFMLSKNIVADYGGGISTNAFLLLKYDKKDGKPVFSKLNNLDHFKVLRNDKEEAIEKP